jgi:hypothetical protein
MRQLYLAHSSNQIFFSFNILMPFNGTEGTAINQNTAGDWTKNYREQQGSTVLSHFFGREILQDILEQPGCMGIRFYYAIDGNGNKQLVAAGANAEENDQLGDTFKVADDSKSGPPASGAANILNS